VLLAAAGVEDDRGGVVQSLGDLEQFQVVGVSGKQRVLPYSQAQLAGVPRSSWRLRT